MFCFNISSQNQLRSFDHQHRGSQRSLPDLHVETRSDATPRNSRRRQQRSRTSCSRWRLRRKRPSHLLHRFRQHRKRFFDGRNSGNDQSSAETGPHHTGNLKTKLFSIRKGYFCFDSIMNNSSL